MDKDTYDKSRNDKSHPILLKHNLFIAWNPEYDLGIPIIDEQHRGIVSTINSLYFGTQNNYAKDILTPIVDMVFNYTRIHFQVEEDFLYMADFPAAKKHHDLHSELSSNLSRASRGSIFHKDPREFIDFLKNWWINHICKEDLIYRDYFRKTTEK
jgi:hemerythrin